MVVSIHAPAQGATELEYQRQMILNTFQSTHPHRVRRVAGFPRRFFVVVSIHAPAQGATLHGVVDLQAVGVSIHAPAQGATCFWQIWSMLENVSIHAPAQGATAYSLTI